MPSEMTEAQRARKAEIIQEIGVLRYHVLPIPSELYEELERLEALEGSPLHNVGLGR